MSIARYTSRFAPSPTGHLHLGSVYTALASFLDAKANHGLWKLRFDDLDTTRNIAGATSSILKTLETLGLHWDGEVDFQSKHLNEYEAVLNDLLQAEKIYRCECSRKDVTSIYSQRCRNKNIASDIPNSLRIKIYDKQITFHDGLQGRISHNLALQHGDFILKRRDNIIAYQFAVVLDDLRQNIDHVVRGFDLLNETPKQIFLQQILNCSTPTYSHIPILVNKQGQKLSKQTLADGINLATPHVVLFQLLQLLNQNPSPELQRATVEEILCWAISNWQITALEGTSQVVV